MSMSRVQLGNSDIQVSPVCVGCWQFNGGKADETWPAQPEEVGLAEFSLAMVVSRYHPYVLVVGSLMEAK